MSLLVGYGRLVILGLAPLTPWDTAGLLAAGGMAFVLHQFSGLQPFYRLALWLPLLALATTPWQLASPWMGGTLLAVGIAVSVAGWNAACPLPLYLGAGVGRDLPVGATLGATVWTVAILSYPGGGVGAVVAAFTSMGIAAQGIERNAAGGF
ncbi:MAG: hypothetical protein R3F37_21605 [Candidatus Competibacteraceae bacterium]